MAIGREQAPAIPGNNWPCCGMLHATREESAHDSRKSTGNGKPYAPRGMSDPTRLNNVELIQSWAGSFSLVATPLCVLSRLGHVAGDAELQLQPASGPGLRYALPKV